MTADSNTRNGQEPEPPRRNPYLEDGLPAGQDLIPPEADPKKTRFSAAAITGMVLVSIGWAITIRPLVSFAVWSDDSDFSIFNFFAFFGLLVLLGGVTGFIVALLKENRRLAARLYIIPSLIWHGGVLTVLILLLIALSQYDAT